MLQLTTLDGVSLSLDGRVVSAVQNRRQSVALLLLLATAGRRGVSRERVAELLWPDGAVRDPRHSLDQLLSVTRSAAGAPLVDAAGALRLDPDIVRVDVAAFDEALRAHRREEAVALYRSPFADGFVAPSPAVTDVLDAERARIDRAHAAAVRELAEAAEKRGDLSGAVGWWQTLQLTDRLDAAVAVRLVASLAASGRRLEALRTARTAAALLEVEGGYTSSDLASWIARLSDGSPHDDGPTPMSAVPARVREPDASPTTLGGRYRIERELRRSRIVTTYLATDGTGRLGVVEAHVLEGPVAAAAPAAHFIELFRRVMAVGHPQILPTLDAGADGPLRWVVTARRPEQTLAARLDRDRPLPVPEALTIARDLAAALAHAHVHGLCHGDLRPKQIALTGDRACLCALGLAESVIGVGAGDSAVLTLGSALYQSPEQLLGDTRMDARSDVYAFGCVLFEMLAGAPPFDAATSAGRVQRLTQRAPPLGDLRDTVPDELARVVATCLARVPADRYPSAEALLPALLAGT